MFAEMPCRLTSNINLFTTRNLTLQSSKKQNPCMIYSRMQINKGVKIPSAEFRWIGSYIIEKVLRINNYLVRKIGTNKIEVLLRMRLRQFTTRQPLADIQILPQDRKADTEVSIKHEDLYAKAWQRDHERPIFDNENDNVMPSKSLEAAVSSDLSTGARGTHQEPHKSRNQVEELRDVTDEETTHKCNLMRKQARNNRTIVRPNPAVRNTINIITRSLIAMTITDINSLCCTWVFHIIHT